MTALRDALIAATDYIRTARLPDLVAIAHSRFPDLSATELHTVIHDFRVLGMWDSKSLSREAFEDWRLRFESLGVLAQKAVYDVMCPAYK